MDRRRRSPAAEVLAPVLTAVLAVVLAGCAAATGSPAPTAPVPPLIWPVDVAARRALWGMPGDGKPFRCAEAPTPLRDLTLEGFYATDDPSHSRVDPERMAAYKAQSKPLDDMVRALARMRDRWVGTTPADPAPAACAIGWLAAWAEADALLGRISNQGGFERKWALATFATVWLDAMQAPGIDPAAAARVQRWMSAIAAEIEAYYDKPPGRGISSRRNNHMTWAGTALATAAVATGDRARLAWARERVRLTLEQVTAAGHLPLELARRGLALHYHMFTLTALLPTIAIVEANGLPLTPSEAAALERLIGATLAALDTPGPMASAAGGVVQEMTAETVSPGAATWLELWATRAAAPDAIAWRDRLRAKDRFGRMRTSRLGGDVTLGWGAR